MLINSMYITASSRIYILACAWWWLVNKPKHVAPSTTKILSKCSHDWRSFNSFVCLRIATGCLTLRMDPFEKMTVAELVVELAAFYITVALITVFIITRHWTLYQCFRTYRCETLHVCNFRRLLFPIVDPTFLFGVLFSTSLTLFFLSERETKFQTQNDSLSCRFACSNFSF
jgi:hypothetical protein